MNAEVLQAVIAEQVNQLKLPGVGRAYQELAR